jgi:hypothetical protein
MAAAAVPPFQGLGSGGAIISQGVALGSTITALQAEEELLYFPPEKHTTDPSARQR